MPEHASENKSDSRHASQPHTEQANPSTERASPLPLIHRKTTDPRPNLTANDIRILQRTLGNQAVQRMFAEGMLQRRVPDFSELESLPTDSLPDRNRQLEFITIKLRGRGIEHWWIEIDGRESYGWWPVREPEDTTDAALYHGIIGVPGELNAVSRPRMGGTPTRDPHHGDSAPETFNPYTIDRSSLLNDDQIRENIRSFARGFSGDYRIIGGPNCHTFIADLMRSVGLSMRRTRSPVPIVP